jgi:serine/threonine protein phosphatase 1
MGVGTMSRTYAIADLHGRFDLLEKAFSAIHQHAGGADNQIITLGDYIDRGPQSRQIIEHLMAAQKAGMKLICLKGNHEDMMVETLRKPLDPNWWVGNGGETTLRSYRNNVPDRHLDWIAALPSIHADQHRVFVHAGVDPTCPLSDQTDKYLLWYRYINGADIGHGKRHVVHGHTPWPHGPERFQNRTNLDTYAWRSGRLVVGVFDDDLPGGPIDLIEVKGSPAP